MDDIFVGLSLIIAVGAVVAMIMRAIGQPLLIGHILTGIIVGPAALKIVGSEDELRIFAELGIALLLFIIGLGMNPKVVAEVGRPSVITALAHMSITGVIAWLVATGLGLGRTEAIFLAIGLTINSTIVALKLLGDRKETNRLYGKLTIGISLVEDIIAAGLLLMVASAAGGRWLTAGPLSGLLIKVALVAVVMYVIARVLLPKIQKLIASDQELLFLTAIAIGLGGATLVAKIGLSVEIGALAAGVLLASFPYAQEVASRLRPLRDFFVIVFFIALGAQLTFNNFSEMVLPILAGVMIVVLIKPLIIMACLGVLSYTKRTSFKTALALSQVSEFSIIFLVLANEKNLIGHDTVSLLTFIALISIAISTYLVTFSDQLYSKFEPYLDMFERRKTSEEHFAPRSYELVLFGYQRGGHEFINLFKKLKKKYVVIDYDPDVIDTLEQRRLNYLYGDAMDPELLEESGVNSAHLVVSTIPDYEVNKYLLGHLKQKNSRAIVIVHADDPLEAAKLYEAGASYVILPHYLGSEKLSSFINKSGLTKSAFRKERIKHLGYLERHYGALEKLSEINERKVGRAIIKSVTSLTRARV
jgi:Kef-type K+ transport system membrane component KefB/Trk K+ transport system NAD-binding subunit